MLERLRNPKWMAIGFAAIVAAGVLVKVMDRDDVKPTSSKTKTVKAGVPELGRYALAETSWPSSPRSRMRGQTNGTDGGTPQTMRRERRWSGICVAVQGK